MKKRNRNIGKLKNYSGKKITTTGDMANYQVNLTTIKQFWQSTHEHKFLHSLFSYGTVKSAQKT